MQNGSIGFNVVYMVLTMLLLSIVAVFLSLTVSMMSKNMKNAQILNEIILAVPVGITVLLTLGIIKSNMPVFNYIPILNLIVGFNNAFNGYVDITNIILSLITNSIIIAILIFTSIKYMNTEKIIA